MEVLSPGMTVWSLDDRRLGVVSAVNVCCFGFESGEKRRRVSVTPEGIFNINDGRISLIYGCQEAHRYECPGHPADSLAPSPGR